MKSFFYGINDAIIFHIPASNFVNMITITVIITAKVVPTKAVIGKSSLL